MKLEAKARLTSALFTEDEIRARGRQAIADMLPRRKVEAREPMNLHLKKGGFHKWLGKAEDEPITEEDIRKGLDSDDDHVRKMAQFAKNARKWRHK